MIREKSLLCKIIRIKSSSKDLFDSYMNRFQPETETCPCCGSKGNCSIHAYYGRRIIDFKAGRKSVDDVCVLRVICGSCGHTHAILPDTIIPYDRYGIFFILRVLAERFLLGLAVEQICERFSITRNQFYKWLHLWCAHKEEWLGLLTSAETTDGAFLKTLAGMPSFSSFTSAFIRLTAHSFLQSHRNPADYCQQVFSP